MDPHIQFTTEDAEADESIPFLDTIVMPQPDNSLLTTVFRKPTHTDLYLHWNSHHHLSAKFRVVNTLKHRAKTVCSYQQLLKKEEYHLHRALRSCKYPEWTLTRASMKHNKKTGTNQGTVKNTARTGSNNKPYIVVPYIQGMSESCKKHLQKTWGWKCISKEAMPSGTSWCTPRNKDNILQKSGVIYRFTCGRVDCEEEYIGESCRTFSERFREHIKASSPIHAHTTSLVMKCLWTISV